MRKGLGISLIVVLIVLLLIGIWFAKLIWFKPFSIDQFFERAYIEFLWEDPEALSQTGALRSFGLSGYRSELTMVGPAETRRMAEVGRKNLDILQSYDREDLSAENQLSYDVFHWFLQTGVDSEPFLFHDYPITHISGPHIELPQFLTSLQIETRNDIECYLLRLDKVDEKFGSVVDGLEERRKAGVVVPTHILRKAISFCDAFYLTSIEENILYTSFEKKLNSIALLDPQAKQTYLDECAQLLKENVIPAYSRLSKYLLQLEQSSLAIAGVWHLPDGDRYYRQCLLQQTTLHIDPDSLYEFGKMEMARLQGELAILQSLTGNKSLQAKFRTDSLGRSATIEHFNNSINRIQPLLADYFNRIPRSFLSVVEVPESRSESSTFAFYRPPRGEPLGDGRMYINTWKADGLSKHLATTYAYHEGIPGHHLQKGILAELDRLPTFRRFIPFEAYDEGWAMYAERLGHEMTGSEDVWDKIGLLQSDLFRTVRMMTDIGIHHKKWLREQAIDFMVQNTELTAAQAEDEVDRYIVWPGQGCAYKVGQLKFLELRERAESELGDAFDIREFHSVLINQGAMPLAVLEKQVEAYVTEKKDVIKP